MEETQIVDAFKAFCAEGEEVATAVAAVKTLTEVIKFSQATTMMELQVDLKEAVDILSAFDQGSISLTAGTALFNRYVTRCLLEISDFAECKKRIIDRGCWFARKAANCRQSIAELACRFITDETVIFLHGHSRVVTQCLVHAAGTGTHFSVIVTEGRPDFAGHRAAKVLIAAGIPVTIVLDAAVAHHMEKASLVLLGAEGVVENGGIINKIGTKMMCMVAQVLNKPVYVAAESYKFARLFPLTQQDLPEKHQRHLKTVDGGELPNGAKVDNPSCDYTQPQYITSIFSDLGILTPSAVSDELIKLYY